MKYALMHKDIVVAQMIIDVATMTISSIVEINNAIYLPIGVKSKDDLLDRKKLNQWFLSRCVPINRSNIRNDLEILKLRTTFELINKFYALSLSDQYWIKPQNETVSWVDINFFDHKFSHDMGDVLIGKEKSKKKNFNFASPDNTTSGWLRKRWKADGDKRFLIKQGSGTILQEPYNEVFASEVCKILEINHVTYKLLLEEEFVYSVCENFITKDTELISALHIFHSEKKEDSISIYEHYVNCCKEIGCVGIEDSLDKMIILDYIMGNRDRHMNNFGVIRDANTLQMLGAAPVFDSGASLWNDKPVSLINSDLKIASKQFEKTHEEQLQLVQSFDFLQESKLSGLGELYKEITRDSIFMEEERVDAISFALENRVQRLFQIIAKIHK